MEKSFICSLIKNGILGGALYLNSKSLTYKTGKLTVPLKYRNLVMPLKEIKEVNRKQNLFPIVSVSLKNGEEYKFIIFNTKSFIKFYNNLSGN